MSRGLTLVLASVLFYLLVQSIRALYLPVAGALT